MVSRIIQICPFPPSPYLTQDIGTKELMFLFQLDSSLIHLESRLNETRMKKFVNVVILSDHGMTYGHHANNHSVRITKINLLSYLNREHIRSVSQYSLLW